MQKDLCTLQEWPEKWLLKLNVEKCKQLNVGKATESYYYLGNDTIKKNLQPVVEERDLGVIFPKDLKWGAQCQKAAAKAMSMLGMIKRSFPIIDKELFLILYGVYVRLHLEYGVQVWAPYFQKDIVALEKVQQRATKLVKSIKNWSYEGRLRYLGLSSLARRRIRGDLIETFKILNGFEGTDPDHFFTRANTIQLRGHLDKLYKSRLTLQCRRNFFSQQVVSHWNQLPKQVIDAESIDVFKRSIDKYMDKCRDEQ